MSPGVPAHEVFKLFGGLKLLAGQFFRGDQAVALQAWPFSSRTNRMPSTHGIRSSSPPSPK